MLNNESLLKCNRVFSELEKAKEKAAASFQELLSIRSSLSSSTMAAKQSMNDSVIQQSSSNIMMESMRETDLLLEQFRRSLATVPKVVDNHTTTFAPGGTSNLEMSTNDLTSFLDRYSDKLADMVGEKILARMSVSNK